MTTQERQGEKEVNGQSADEKLTGFESWKAARFTKTRWQRDTNKTVNER